MTSAKHICHQLGSVRCGGSFKNVMHSLWKREGRMLLIMALSTPISGTHLLTHAPLFQTCMHMGPYICVCAGTHTHTHPYISAILKYFHFPHMPHSLLSTASSIYQDSLSPLYLDDPYSSHMPWLAAGHLLWEPLSHQQHPAPQLEDVLSCSVLLPLSHASLPDRSPTTEGIRGPLLWKPALYLRQGESWGHGLGLFPLSPTLHGM